MTSNRHPLGCLLLLLLIAAGCVLGWRWLETHPQHNPFAPLEIAHPQGWATRDKLLGLTGNGEACLATLDRAEIAYSRRPPTGAGVCRTDLRIILKSPVGRFPAMSPPNAAPDCAVSIGLWLWNRDVVQPQAQRHFGQRVVRLHNLGSYNCREVVGGRGRSQHSTANAIDISAFVLADGQVISVQRHWAGADASATFLHDVRDGACDLFSTVLSPDYNAAHADHFHFDLAVRKSGWKKCG